MHRKRARLGNARGDPSLWRAGTTSIVGKDFLPAIAPKNPLSDRAMGVLQIARWWNSAPDLPDVSKCFRGIRSKHPCQRPPCYFAWGCFRYFRSVGRIVIRHLGCMTAVAMSSYGDGAQNSHVTRDGSYGGLEPTGSAQARPDDRLRRDPPPFTGMMGYASLTHPAA